MEKDTTINRIYIKKTDFQSIYEFKEYVARTLEHLTKVESNIVVAYQSFDPNVYIIECNISDPALNEVFPFWVTPEELLMIKKKREGAKAPLTPNDFDDFGGFNNGGQA